MTTIEKIRAEIERQIKDPQEHCYGVSSVNKLRELLSFLDTLEPEKPMVQDGLDKEIEKVLREGALSWNISYSDMCFIAEHFYELGCRRTAEKADEIEYNRQRAEECVPNDLEEAARHSEILTYPMPEDGDIEKVFKVQEARVFHEIGFIAGAKWDREQMMKEAVEYEVWDFSVEAYPHVNIPLDNKQYRSGDKVRVIVLPKED